MDAVAKDGCAIHFVEGGLATGVAVAFIHGWTGDAHDWDDAAARLGSRYRTLAVDLAGHGASSSMRRAYTAHAYAEDVLAVMDRVAVDRAVIVGHSMGGHVGLELAATAPSRVIAVVAVDAMHDLSERPRSDAEIDAIFASARRRFTPWVRTHLESTLGPAASDAVRERVGARAAAMGPDLAIAAVRWNYAYPRAEAARRVSVPVVAINGDRFPTHVAGNRRVLPQFRLEIMEATGHYPMLERPAEFAARLAAVLDAVTAT